VNNVVTQLKLGVNQNTTSDAEEYVCAPSRWPRSVSSRHRRNRNHSFV